MIKKIKKLHHHYKHKRAERRKARELAPTAFDHSVITWTAPEHYQHNRGIIWKIVMTVLTLGAIVFGIYYDAWTFSLAIGTFAFVYVLVNFEHPKEVDVQISSVGIKVGGRKYPFSRIRAFWFVYEPPMVKTLNIRVDGELIADIVIQLGDQHPEEVRDYLIKKIPELSGKHESLTEIFLRLLKL